MVFPGEDGVGAVRIVLIVIVLQVAVVEHCQDFIHALNVLDPWVELRIDEEDPVENVSMSLNVVLLVVWSHVSSFSVCLSLKSCLVFRRDIALRIDG